MRVLILGASGMVGHGALRACLAAGDVTAVTALSRRPLARSDAKLTTQLRDSFLAYDDLTATLAATDACLFCLGTSSLGAAAADYRRITVDMPLALGRALAAANPNARMVYVSGAGTDRGSRQMWARTKAEAEAALQALPLRQATMCRPGFIMPTGGAVSGVGWYRAIYAAAAPLYPWLARRWPAHVTDSDRLGRALLAAARGGPQIPAILDTAALNRLAA